MYCRMCGSKLGDADHFCKNCGTPTGIGEPTLTPADEPVIKEEIVFNPPYDKESGFQEDGAAADELDKEEPAGEDPAEGEHRNLKREKEDLKGFILEVDIAEANKIQAEATEAGPEPIKKQTGADEFTWNVHQFPKAKKNTDEAVFNWNMEEFSPPGKKENTAFEEELFQEIREDSTRIKEQNIDRFFTFSRKNEEFQKLLDKEYEKFRTRSTPQTEPISEQSESDVAELTPEAQGSIDIDEEVSEVKAADEEAASVQAVAEPTPVIVPAEAEPPETAKEETKPHKPEHIEEMAGARALFFGEELIRDNESIKKKLEDSSTEDNEGGEAHKAEEKHDSQFTAPEGSQNPEEVSSFENSDAPNLAAHPEDSDAGLTAETAESQEQSGIPLIAPVIPAVDEDGEESRGKRNIWQILLIIIAIILAVEIAILGIRYFDPDSIASKAIGKAQTEIYNTVTGWAEGIKDMFSGKASEEGNKTENKGQDVGKDNAGETSPPAVGQPGVTEPDKTAPNPAPMADKNALVTSQMGNNKNIEQVKANTALAYQSGKDYGIADLNQSKPIANNIWKAPENGEPVYYDKSVVGTLIAFDSKWIDYVNSGDKSVLELLKKDGKAYQNAAGFTKTGKIKETFKLLEIGEIRQGTKGFYVWTHEELQLTEKGKTTLKKYNWIYYLEPVEEKLQIVNYFKFQ